MARFLGLIVVWLCFLFFLSKGHAQLVEVNPAANPEALVESLFSGNCTETSNYNSAINGSVNGINSFGQFTKGNSNFPFESGIVLTTGAVEDISDVNATESMSAGDISWLTSSDLEQVLGIQQTLNATSIEFNVSSASDQLRFNYIFASDEYQQEYPCTFADLFVILIRKTNSTEPFRNMAILPDSDMLVATNTIRTEIEGFCEAQNEFYFEGFSNGDTNFKARTIPMTASAPVVPGEAYTIKLIIADDIDQRFDSAVFIEAVTSENSIDLGPDIEACGTTASLDADIGNSLAEYSWFKDGALIANETEPTLQVTESGEYTVSVNIPFQGSSCSFTDSVQVVVIPFEPAPEISELIVCDDPSNDGIEEVDLTIKSDEILNLLLGDPSNYQISYFTSEEEALNNENPIIGLYQNTETTETIYTRIESLDGSCLQVGSFELILGNLVESSDYTIQICNGLFREGFYFENIDYFDARVIEFQTAVDVAFFLNENDALSGINEVLTSFDIPESTEFLYAVATDLETQCQNTFSVDIDFVEGPSSADDFYVIDLCKNPDIPFQSFTLEDILDEVEIRIPGAVVVFFPTEEDALLEQNQYFNPFGPIVINNQTPHLDVVYMSIINSNQSTCPRISPLELHTNLAFNVVDNSSIINKCDDPSGDGQESFLVADIIEEIKGKYSQVFIDLFETEEDLLSDENELALNTELLVDGSRDIFVSASNGECIYTSSITLKVNPFLDLSPTSLNYCGVQNSSGTTTIFLQDLVETAQQDIEDAIVQFYENELDAIDEVNEISTSIDINGSGVTLYTKVTDLETSCSDITSIQVNVSEPISLNPPNPLVYCGELKNGTFEVDLEQVLPELGIDLNNFEIGFYPSLADAETSANEISNPQNYVTASQTFFIRIEYPFVGCAVYTSFEVLVYEEPVASDISPFRSCQNSETNTSEFLFSEKDEDILNGQEGVLVSYYHSEQEAIDKANEIDKTQPYTNQSNPELIYVRLENDQRTDCFTVASFNIEVKPAVSYNEPENIFACDLNENGQVIVDLNGKITEILNGQPQDQEVSFYSSIEDAEASNNTLPFSYTNIINPEPVYFRVENTEGCYTISSFIVNVLELPGTNSGQTLKTCAFGNSDQLWDLTNVELDILDGRQYNIGFEYYETESALNAGINNIIDPENYINTNDLNSLFVKVINRTTGCFKSVPFELEIESGPEWTGVSTYDVCENENNEVQLNEVEALLRVPGDQNSVFNFYNSLQNANQDINRLDTSYIYSSLSDLIFIRVINPETNCFIVEPITINVIESPPALTPPDLEACDDDYDGLYPFNFADQASEILGSLNPDEYTVTFYATLEDAETIENELPSTYFGSDEQSIYARLQQTSTGCFSIVDFKLKVRRNPFVEIPVQYLCTNELPLIVNANTGVSSDAYSWSTGDQGNSTNIYATGSYWLDISTEFGCTNRILFEVQESESATITNIEVTNFTDPNTITVFVDGNGNYSYQLDDNEAQLSNTFEDVPIGFRTITVSDLNGCSSVSETVLVMDTPKFFTPNNDGVNDLWQIPGLELLPGSEIKIFNRTGKLLVILDANSEGWDGTYNGRNMPASDYWFTASLVIDNETYQINGHFTLKR